MLGISVRTLHNWEQGRRIPEGPAMVLLRIAEKHPESLLDVDSFSGLKPVNCSIIFAASIRAQMC